MGGGEGGLEVGDWGRGAVVVVVVVVVFVSEEEEEDEVF